jgi:MinD-like ATPase involved in chromosome partitioning or flagellar assembly
MAKPTTAFVAKAPSVAVFAGAEQVADYDEEVVTKTRGSRPRRSEQRNTAPTVPHLIDEGSGSAPESAANSRHDQDPERPPEARDDPLGSALFAGAMIGAETSAHRTVHARSGLRGWLNQLGFKLPPGSAESAVLEREHELAAAQATIRQATWTRAVSVLVANPKGGTGKTPLSLLLGGTLASIRGGSVAVIEVADDPGALAYRAEGTPRLGIGDLVRDADHIRTAGQLAGYTAPQTSFAAVIGSTTRRPRLEADGVAAMVRVIDEYYSIRVMDSGNQPTSSAFQGALAATDVLVVPVVNAGDSTLEAVRMLDGLRDAGGHAADVATRAIVVRVTDGRPETAAINAEVARIMTAAGAAAICDLPYDPHIAERGQLTLGSLRSETRTALTRIAATVVGAVTEHATRQDAEVNR